MRQESSGTGVSVKQIDTKSVQTEAKSGSSPPLANQAQKPSKQVPLASSKSTQPPLLPNPFKKLLLWASSPLHLQPLV